MLALLLSCTSPGIVDSGFDVSDSDTDLFLGVGEAQVSPSGPYGTHTFDLPADTHWVNTGVFLRAGESLEISATGTWSLDGQELGAEGDASLGDQRGCALGSLAVRSGLRFEDEIQCLGTGGTFTAETDDIVYAGMIFATGMPMGSACGLTVRYR